jgi:hypothetical protein
MSCISAGGWDSLLSATAREYPSFTAPSGTQRARGSSLGYEQCDDRLCRLGVSHVVALASADWQAEVASCPRRLRCPDPSRGVSFTNSFTSLATPDRSPFAWVVPGEAPPQAYSGPAACFFCLTRTAATAPIAATISKTRNQPKLCEPWDTTTWVTFPPAELDPATPRDTCLACITSNKRSGMPTTATPSSWVSVVGSPVPSLRLSVRQCPPVFANGSGDRH